MRPIIACQNARRTVKVSLRTLTAALVAASLLEALYYFHVVQDGALISLRHAATLVHRGGVGPPPPGSDDSYSNVTWVLLIAAAYLAHIPPLLALKIIGLICLAASLIGTARLVDELLGRVSHWRLLAVVVAGSSAFFTSWSVQGLETPLVAMLVVWGALALIRLLRDEDAADSSRRAVLSGILFGVLGLSRPETVLFAVIAVGILVAAHGRGGESIIIRFAAASMGPVILQLAFGATGAPIQWSVHRGLEYLSEYVRAKGMLLSLMAEVVVLWSLMTSLRRPAREQTAPLAVTALLVAYGAFIVVAGGDFLRGFRLFMHVLPLGAALVAWALSNASDALAQAGRPTLRSAAIAIAVLLMLYSNVILERKCSFGAQGALSSVSSGLGFYGMVSMPAEPDFEVASLDETPDKPKGTLMAAPNPVPAGPGLGETTLSWGGWDGAEAELFVSEAGGPERLFASGAQGTARAPWIQTGPTYVFRLYGPGRRPLAAVQVTREK